MDNAVISACADEANDAYKKQINALYNKIYSALPAQNADDAAKFEQSQKAWLAYRNSYCELTGQYIGSPMYEICPMELNAACAKELAQLAENF